MNAQVTEYIEKAPGGQREIMEAVRHLVHESVPEVREEFKWSRPVFAAGKDFAYLQTTKSHVNLGFFNSAGLDDERGLLQGTGKDMRHIKLASANDVETELLSRWFRAAAGVG